MNAEMFTPEDLRAMGIRTPEECIRWYRRAILKSDSLDLREWFRRQIQAIQYEQEIQE